MEKYAIKDKKEFLRLKKSIFKKDRYNRYYFDDPEPTQYPCVAIVIGTAIPDTYLTEYNVGYVCLSDFSQ